MDYQAAMAESRTVTEMFTASQREIARLTAELAIERERNSHRVICPKCQASLPCESCQRYQADLDAALALLREVRDAVLDVIPYDDVIPIDLLARIEELLEKETP